MPTPMPFRNLPPTGQTLVALLVTAATVAVILQREAWGFAALVGILPVFGVQTLCRRHVRSALQQHRQIAEMERRNASLIAALEEAPRATAGREGGNRCLTPTSVEGALRVSPAAYGLSAALRNPADTRTVVDALAREAIRVAPGVTAAVALIGDDGLFRVVSAIGLYSDRLLDLAMPSAPDSWQQALRLGRPEVNVAPDDGLLRAIPTPGSADLRCALVAPLIHEGRALGVVSVYHTRRNAYAARDAERLSLVTEIIAESLCAASPEAGPIREPGPLRVDPAEGEMERRLEARLRRSPATRAPFAVLLLHLDRLESDATPLGLAADDPMLAEAASVVRACLRPGDALEYRVDSGFAVILENATSDASIRVCSRITTAVERMAAHLGMTIAASAGYGVCPGDGHTACELLGAANRRLRMDRGARLLD